MIQVIGYLLCVYLVFKGLEIFQIAYVSERKWNEMPWLLGACALVGSIIIAAFFAWWLSSIEVQFEQSLREFQKGLQR